MINTRETEFVIYALYNARHSKIYIGSTNDLDRRLKQHNEGHFGASYTARFTGKWTLIYEEKCKTRSVAIRREKQLKSYRGRQYIKSLIPR